MLGGAKLACLTRNLPVLGQDISWHLLILQVLFDTVLHENLQRLSADDTHVVVFWIPGYPHLSESSWGVILSPAQCRLRICAAAVDQDPGRACVRSKPCVCERGAARAMEAFSQLRLWRGREWRHLPGFLETG